LGELRLAQSRLEDAENLFRQALTLNPDLLEALRGMVQVFLLKNKPAEALDFVQKQVARQPNSSSLYLLQAEVLRQTKQTDQAQSSLSRAVELDNKNVDALSLLAQLEAESGQYDQAIVNYQRAIVAAPTDTRFYIALGSVYQLMGNWQQAEATYQKALAIQPDNALAANNLAYLLLEHGGDPNVALSLAQTARKGLPKLPNSADTLGWAYYHNGAYSVAAPLIEDAVKNVPKNQAYRYHLGLTYQKLNDSSRAKVELEKAIALNPTSPLAEQARRALSELTGG
jgi:tetratricopeptide (TPR) repeat protein